MNLLTVATGNPEKQFHYSDRGKPLFAIARGVWEAAEPPPHFHELAVNYFAPVIRSIRTNSSAFRGPAASPKLTCWLL